MCSSTTPRGRDGLASSARVLNCHVLQAQNVLVREELQQLDFSECRDGELSNCQRGAVLGENCKGALTPSFSLCIMIFFRATKAPVFFALARWTSLHRVSDRQWRIGGRSSRHLPKGTLAEFAQDLIVGDP
jgi:hypothetical protein